MTRSSARSRRKPRPDRRGDIHIPHSSWSRAPHPAAAGGSPIAPDDFWSRLGL
ncbi:MAG TPA: hypothetical protein VJ762_00695 [Sphingobium sp.]|nr:hypothetical protein [Sphingobium sp.]